VVNAVSTAATVLTKIVAQRQQRIAELAAYYQPEQLAQQLQPSQRSLAAALAQPRASFILECKKASPSKGLIRANFNAVELAQTYARYADAISVLTEPDFFQGDFSYLAAVSAAVDIPVLCKDFITEPLQVLLARHFGADAILLMLSILDDQQYLQLAALAERYQLDVLTEVATAEEMHRAARLGATIIGINNRNLHDLSIDPQRSIALSQLAPAGALLVAESGFSEHTAVRTSAPYVDGFLVGSALAAQANVDQACRELIYGQHKVCGLASAADAMVVRAAGAAYGGLIHVSHSPRYVDLAQAQAIGAAEPLLRYVGVFADQPLAEVVAFAEATGLFAVQLHGHEDIDYISQLRQALPTGTHIWKAIGVDEPLLLPELRVDRYVLDNRYGGSGSCFDWQLLTSLTTAQLAQCMIAGGINQANAAAAQATGIERLDINSGVEYRKGQKDAGLIIQFFNQLRQYGRTNQ
jgi:indole-3-glycerol phosphate synthase/phosphoribosylanthranilate isomerase